MEFAPANRNAPQTTAINTNTSGQTRTRPHVLAAAETTDRAGRSHSVVSTLEDA